MTNIGVIFWTRKRHYSLLISCGEPSTVLISKIEQIPLALFYAQDKHLPQCSIHSSYDDDRNNDINVKWKPSTTHIETPTNSHISQFINLFNVDVIPATAFQIHYAKYHLWTWNNLPICRWHLQSFPQFRFKMWDIRFYHMFHPQPPNVNQTST